MPGRFIPEGSQDTKSTIAHCCSLRVLAFWCYNGSGVAKSGKRKRHQGEGERMSSKDIAGINWSADRLLPAFQTPKHLTIYDLRGASNEVQLSAATMAGLINRPEPMVYQIITDQDAFWLKELLGGIPQESSPTSGNDVLDGMLIPFRSAVQGIVIYDPNFIDSINIATTIAGQNNCIIVS